MDRKALEALRFFVVGGGVVGVRVVVLFVISVISL